jgi:hypothetical protein
MVNNSTNITYDTMSRNLLTDKDVINIVLLSDCFFSHVCQLLKYHVTDYIDMFDSDSRP